MKTRIGLKIDEERFKPDMDLSDRYVAYSAEILRLSLLGMAGYAFLLKEIVYAATSSKELSVRLAQNRWVLIGGIVSLGISAALALQHRIFATDAIACMIDHLRFRIARNLAGAERQASDVSLNLKWSGRFLQFSALFLGLGAAAVVLTFARVLWS